MADEQHVLTTAAVRPATARWLIAGAMLLTGLSMRTAVTSVGPILSDLEAGLGVSSGVAGIVTTLPVVCFALIGTTAPRLSHRYGEHLLLVGSMCLMTVGVVARALAGSIGSSWCSACWRSQAGRSATCSCQAWSSGTSPTRSAG